MASQAMPPADRIRELNAINEDVPAMLKAAGQAIAALSPKGLQTEEDTEMAQTDTPTQDLESRKHVFEENTKAFYTHVQAITARFRRQAYALEEAGIIAPENVNMSSATQQAQGGAQGKKPETDRITNGGLGNLDVGYLNSRGNKVGAEKEAELMVEAKELLQEMLQT